MTYNPSDWKPGDIAVVTCADEDVPSFVTEKEGRLTWHHVGHSFFKSTAVTNTHYNTAARRLVVIDPEDREEVERLARELMETTDRLQAALREFAIATPPKPQKTGTLIEYRGDDGRQYFVEPALTGKFQDAKNDLDRVKLAHVVIDGYGVAKNRAGK